MNRNVIRSLKEVMQEPLPGIEAQYRMAPSYRPDLKPEAIAARQPRKSAVMVLLYEKEESLHVVLTKRKEYPGVHSGQMSFPGGKMEETDENLLVTAIRETEEEIGVRRQEIEVLGALSELYIPPSNFLVFPAVGFAGERPVFHAQQDEVERIVEVPVAHLMKPSGVNMKTEIRLYNGNMVTVPAYVYEGHVIWGATAIMLSEFTFLMERALER